MSDAPPRRVRPRHWIVPPGLIDLQEPFDGCSVLDEIRTPAGVVIWHFIRDADLWSATPPDARIRLFAPGVRRRRRERIASLSTTAALRVPLERIGRALDGRGTDPDDEMARACTALARWAEDQGLPQTALAAAQSAALALPGDPAMAYAVGVLARRNAQYRRAESWFRRALGLARRGNDWRHYGLASIGLGNVHRQRGDYPTARMWFSRALHTARRRGLAEVRAMALHDLFCVAANGDLRLEAEHWARRAALAYGARHPRVVILAHDVARYWLLQGRYDEAHRVFGAVLPHVRRIPERRVVVANMARAAAGLGDRLSFSGLWAETWRLVDEYEDGEGVAEALWILAEGAAALGDPDRAQVAATQALKTARTRRENEHRLAAERVLESLRTVRLGVPAPAPEVDEAPAAAVPGLVQHLVETLAAVAGERFPY